MLTVVDGLCNFLNCSQPVIEIVYIGGLGALLSEVVSPTP